MRKWRDGVVKKILRTKFSIWDAVSFFFASAILVAFILVVINR